MSRLYNTSGNTRPLVHSTLWLVLACVLVAGHPAHAQSGLEVYALNADTGEPVPNIVVHVENEGIGYADRRSTNEKGKVQWAGLSTSGAYRVFVDGTDRFYAAQARDVTLRSNFTKSVTLLLPPIQEVQMEEVVVEGGQGIAEVNKVNAEVSSTLPAQALEDIPVEGRNFTQSLYRLPNVTQSTGFFSEAPNVSINGANGLFTQYLVDGMDNNENFLGGPQFEVPTGVVKDITVLTSTYSAEFGRTGNGVFNVTTKSGSNQYEGEAFYLTRPGPPLDGQFANENGQELPQRDLSGNQVQDGFQRQQGGVTLGGPIVKDQTFFFVNLEHTTDWKDNLLESPALGVQETVQGQNHFTYGSARIDHRWSDVWRSTLRANVNRVRVDRQGGALGGGVTFASAANTQERDGVHVALQNTYAGERLVYEGNVQYSRFNWNFADPALGNSPQVAIRNPQGTTVGVLGDPGFRFDSVENTLQVQQKLTYRLGGHTLKAGVDVLSADFSLEGGGNPNGNYIVRLNDSQLGALARRDLTADLRPTDLRDLPGTVDVINYGVELRPTTFGTRQDLVGLYLEDEFSPVADLNVTAGLRWDYDSLSKGGATTGDWNNFAPRLSLNYALGRRSSVRGGYGIFYDKIVYSVYSDALQFSTDTEGFRSQIRSLVDQGILPSDTNVDRVTHRGNLTANVSDVPFLDGPSPADLRANREQIRSDELRILNPNGYDNPLTHQFSLGVQRQFGSDKLFYVDLIHTRSFNLFRLRDLNAPAPFDITPEELQAARQDPDRTPADLVRPPEQADATRPVDVVPGGAKRIIMTEMAGEARYWAANVNLVKDRAEDWYSYRLSYTLSERRNNTEDINFLAEDANNFEAEWGPSVNDRTHVISAVGTVYPIEGLSVTLTALLQSGQPINRVPDASVFGTRDLNGDGLARSADFLGNGDRWPGAGRNGDRLPWSETFDLSVQYAFPLSGGRIVARADIFNVLNTENLSGFANNATQSNQIQVGPPGAEIVEKNAGPPRQFQFGLRYEF